MLPHKSQVHPGLNRKPGESNWVDKAGGLPNFIERIAKHIHSDSGYTISHAIASAVNRVKKLAVKGNAQAVKALAEWETKKGKSHLNNATDVEFAIHLANKIQESINLTNVPGWQGSVGPFPDQYGEFHVYACDVQSGAGNCVCGRDKNHRLHTGIDLAEKEGSKAAGVNSTSALSKAAAAYKRKKKKMSPAQRKKTEARLKSSKQRLTGDGHMNLAFGGRVYDETKHVRAQGGRFGNKGGAASAGASNNSATGQEAQDFPSLVQKLKLGQSVTLPNSKIKIKKVENGYQVWDGKNNVVVKTYEAAISRAQAFARGGGNKNGNTPDTTK